MVKLKRTNTVKTYVIGPKLKAVDKRLDRKQKLEDKLDNIMEVVDELNFQKGHEFYGAEDIKAQENFLKLLILEADIAASKKNAKSTSPALRKAKIKRQMDALKSKIDFLKNAIEQQKKNLTKCKENKDSRSYELTRKLIEKLNSEYKETKEKYIGYTRILRFLKN